jgi:hypothetical protein
MAVVYIRLKLPGPGHVTCPLPYDAVTRRETVTRKGKETNDGKVKGKATDDSKWKGMGTVKGNGKRKGIVNVYKADSDREAKLEGVYLEPEALPAVSLCSDDDTDSTEPDGKYDSEHNTNVDMCMDEDVDALDGIDLDGDGDMVRDGDN